MLEPSRGGRLPIVRLTMVWADLEQCLLGHKRVFATSLPIDLAALKEIVDVC